MRQQKEALWLEKILKARAEIKRRVIVDQGKIFEERIYLPVENVSGTSEKK